MSNCQPLDHLFACFPVRVVFSSLFEAIKNLEFLVFKNSKKNQKFLELISLKLRLASVLGHLGGGQCKKSLFFYVRSCDSNFSAVGLSRWYDGTCAFLKELPFI